MRKNVLIISSSPRKAWQSETLAASFAKGAQEPWKPCEKQFGFVKSSWVLQRLSGLSQGRPLCN